MIKLSFKEPVDTWVGCFCNTLWYFFLQTFDLLSANCCIFTLLTVHWRHHFSSVGYLFSPAFSSLCALSFPSPKISSLSFFVFLFLRISTAKNQNINWIFTMFTWSSFLYVLNPTLQRKCKAYVDVKKGDALSFVKTLNFEFFQKDWYVERLKLCHAPLDIQSYHLHSLVLSQLLGQTCAKDQPWVQP